MARGGGQGVAELARGLLLQAQIETAIVVTVLDTEL
jgi:hypothetical protein